MENWNEKSKEKANEKDDRVKEWRGLDSEPTDDVQSGKQNGQNSKQREQGNGQDSKQREQGNGQDSKQREQGRGQDPTQREQGKGQDPAQREQGRGQDPTQREQDRGSNTYGSGKENSKNQNRGVLEPVAHTHDAAGEWQDRVGQDDDDTQHRGKKNQGDPKNRTDTKVDSRKDNEKDASDDEDDAF